MLQTYEATLEPDGQVLFTDYAKPVYRQRQKVLITVIAPAEIATHEPSDEVGVLVTTPSARDWRSFVGALKASSVFAGDPVVSQQQLRSEWP